MHVFLCGCLGAAEKNPKETQRLLDGAGVAAGDESRLLQYQWDQKADGETGGAGRVAVSYWGLGGKHTKTHTHHDRILNLNSIVSKLLVVHTTANLMIWKKH